MKNRNRSNFLELMECFICTYLPDSTGAKPNTVTSYKTACRLLIVFMYEKKGVPADALTFGMLDYATPLRKTRGCPHFYLFPSMPRTGILMRHAFSEAHL